VGKEHEIRKQKLLIVEGNHERDFFEKWLETLNKDDIQVMPIGGKTLIKSNLPILLKQAKFPDVVSMLIIRDADDSAKSAFDSVESALISVGLPCPESSWTFTQETTPKVGVAILPAKDQTGALEELLLQTIDGDPMSVKSNDFIDDAIVTLNNPDYRNPSPSHRVGKAKGLIAD